MPDETASTRKTVRVAAAIIRRDDGRVLAMQRGYGEFEGGWEFPGGKLESGETSLQACRREIAEELGVGICDERLVHTVEYDYPAFHLSMDCYLCRIAHGTLELREHEGARWVGAEDIDALPWLPADAGLVQALKPLLRDRQSPTAQ